MRACRACGLPYDRGVWASRGCGGRLTWRFAEESEDRDTLPADAGAWAGVPEHATPPAHELRPGELIAGYQIEEVAGRGGMGVVYRALDPGLGRHVALKLVAPVYSRDQAFRARFQREARLAARIEHPNVVPVYGAGEERGHLYIAMRYVEGTDLRSLLTRHGRLDPMLAVHLVAQVAQALDAAHLRGLVHRDVKPANVLLTGVTDEAIPAPGEQAQAYLTDFGISFQRDDTTTLSGARELVGTVAYAAPEQLTGAEVDARADVYALGGVLYHCLTGAVPYRAAHPVEVIAAHLNAPVPTPSRIVPELPPRFDEVVARAMAKEPADRFPSAGELGRAAVAAARLVRPLAALPPRDVELIGRDEQIADGVEQLLRPEVRLLTLTGPGGVGKTALAIEIGRRLEQRFPDGVRYVPLAPVASAEHVASTVSRAVGAGTDHHLDSRAALLAAVADEQSLVIIDNFEHVMSAAPLISDLIAAGPGMTLLITSRELLRLRGERAFPIEPLPVPSAAEASGERERSPALELFAARAEARDPSFRLTHDNTAAVAELCARLDGLPLAIELAAARVGLLSPAQLVDRLGDVMGSITIGPRDAPARQQTLRATIEWSVRLSSPRERDAFIRLAVFAGGCTLEAAEQVGETSLDVLDALVTKSLLQHRDGRLIMLGTLREYGLEELGRLADRDAIRRRHAEWCLQLAQEHSFNVLRWSGSSEQLLDAEVDNLRLALGWSAQNDRSLHAELAATMRQFWWGTGRREEGLAEVQAALDAAAGTLRPRAHAGLLHARAVLSDFDAPGRRADAAEGLARFEDLGDDSGALECVIALMELETHRGDWDAARELGERATAVARRSGEPLLIGRALLCCAFAQQELNRARPLATEAAIHLRDAGSLGELAHLLSITASLAIYEEAYEDADALLEEALEAARAAGVAPRLLAVIQGNRGLTALFTGRLEDAADAFRAELAHGRVARFAFNVLPEGLLGLAAVSAAKREYERAALLSGAAEASSDRTVFGPDAPVLERVHARFIVPARAALSEAAWRRMQRHGASMRVRDAVADALETPSPGPPRSAATPV